MDIKHASGVHIFPLASNSTVAWLCTGPYLRIWILCTQASASQLLALPQAIPVCLGPIRASPPALGGRGQVHLFSPWLHNLTTDVSISQSIQLPLLCFS